MLTVARAAFRRIRNTTTRIFSSRKAKNNHVRRCSEPRVTLLLYDALLTLINDSARARVDVLARTITVQSKPKLPSIICRRENATLDARRDVDDGSFGRLSNTVLCQRWWWWWWPFFVGVMRAKTSRTLDRLPRDFLRQRLRRCGRHFTPLITDESSRCGRRSLASPTILRPRIHVYRELPSWRDTRACRVRTRR